MYFLQTDLFALSFCLRFRSVVSYESFEFLRRFFFFISRNVSLVIIDLLDGGWQQVAINV